MSMDAWFVFGVQTPGSNPVRTPLPVTVRVFYTVLNSQGQQVSDEGKTFGSELFTMNAEPVPEPASGGLMIVALLTVGLVGRFRARR
jgi:hypothetical protein